MECKDDPNHCPNTKLKENYDSGTIGGKQTKLILDYCRSKCDFNRMRITLSASV